MNSIALITFIKLIDLFLADGRSYFVILNKEHLLKSDEFVGFASASVILEHV